MATSSLGSYANVAVATADPGALVVQLFDGAQRFLRQARLALEAADQPGFAYAVTRAHAIIAELSNALDREAGGEVAANLDRLYDFMLRYLTEGLTQKSGSHIERVAAM